MLQLFDTIRFEQIMTLGLIDYKEAGGIIVVYDIANRDSFNDLNSRINEIHHNKRADAIILLIGNKCDLDLNRKVTYEEGNQFAKLNGMMFIETSALTNQNVQDAFELFAKTTIKIKEGIDSTIAHMQSKEQQ